MEVLDNIPFNLDVSQIMTRMRAKQKDEHIRSIITELVDMAQPVARPKAVFEVAYIGSKNGDTVQINGVKFTSRVLRVNLDKVDRVFPYVITCGTEMDRIAISPDEIMKYYCFDAVKETVLRSALVYFVDYLSRIYDLGQLSRMNPGSLADWPITEQRLLFSIFGNVEKLIGVKLTESLIMVPLKSMSGIAFPTKVKFEACQLCSREVCTNRRMPYDAELEKKYRLKV